MGLGWKLEYNHPHLIPLHIKGEEGRGRTRTITNSQIMGNGCQTSDFRLQTSAERGKRKINNELHEENRADTGVCPYNFTN
jgi:hypothetical protein